MSSESPKASVSTALTAPVQQEGQPGPRAALLEQCWALVETGLLAQLAPILQEAQLTLVRSGDKAAARLARDLSLHLSALAQTYRAALRAGFESALGTFLAGGHKAAPSAPLGSGLSLMGMVESDISGQIEQASARLRDLVQNSWVDLSLRLQTLSGCALPESELPLRPSLFLQAVAGGLGLGEEAPAALARVLPAALAPALAATYDAVNRLLAQAGVEAHAVVRAAPVLRPSGPATMQRNVPATVRRDAAGLLKEPLLAVDIEPTSAEIRKSGPVRSEHIPVREVPEDQPDAWGLREYVRLQALFGVNASVLLDSSLNRLNEGPESAAAVRDVPSRPLISAMIGAQKLDAARVAGQVATADAAQEPMGTREYSQRLIGLAGLPVHKHTVQLVARIFARMERDRIVPETVRSLLVALRFPFMEVALADPSVLVRPEHPARVLINAIATASFDWAPELPGGRRYLQQARTAVKYVLGSPGAAAGGFVHAQVQFAEYLAESGRTPADGPVARAREALRAAEEREGRAQELGTFLADLLAGAPLDPVLRQFLQRDWARVLVEVAASEASQPGMLRRMLSVVPDLVWSVQPVTSVPERKRFVEVVPAILESLREGVTCIGWSGTRLRELVEQLRAMHARALAAGDAAAAAGNAFSVSTVRIRLDGFRMEALVGPPHLRPFEVVEEAVHHFLESQGCGVLHRRVQGEKPSVSDALDPAQAEQIIDRWRPGTWFDLRIGRSTLRVRLEGFTPARSLALFSSVPESKADAKPESQPGTALPASLYSLSHASLLAYVRNSWMSPAEPVPLLARAFRTVLSDLKRAAQAAADGGNLGR